MNLTRWMIRIVKALQGQKQIYSMIGSGMNDVSALKEAGIGLDMFLESSSSTNW